MYKPFLEKANRNEITPIPMSDDKRADIVWSQCQHLLDYENFYINFLFKANLLYFAVFAALLSYLVTQETNAVASFSLAIPCFLSVSLVDDTKAARKRISLLKNHIEQCEKELGISLDATFEPARGLIATTQVTHRVLIVFITVYVVMEPSLPSILLFLTPLGFQPSSL